MKSKKLKKELRAQGQQIADLRADLEFLRSKLSEVQGVVVSRLPDAEAVDMEDHNFPFGVRHHEDQGGF